MAGKRIHIISFDIPWPANYGGVIDVFYKIKALHQIGWKIHLHCFTYGRNPSKELDRYCENVNYYPRNILRSQLLKKLPYIVCSRDNDSLLKNLLADDFPILFEGLHSTFHLADEKLKGRNTIVRTHNIEHEYYRQLALNENNFFRKYYFKTESVKLKTYEKILNNAKHIAAISPYEEKHFLSQYPDSVFYLPAFHPNETVNTLTGIGDYILYHGNLAVGENHQAALFLAREVFDSLKYPLIIAGNNPRRELKMAVNRRDNITLIENPDLLQMESLIRDAQIHILPSFQLTGIKLKLLSALFNGRHVLVNETMIKDTGLETLCSCVPDVFSFQQKIKELMKTPMEEKEINKRREILMSLFSNSQNALILENKISNS